VRMVFDPADDGGESTAPSCVEPVNVSESGTETVRGRHGALDGAAGADPCIARVPEQPRP
jgi:hypothetical protein